MWRLCKFDPHCTRLLWQCVGKQIQHPKRIICGGMPKGNNISCFPVLKFFCRYDKAINIAGFNLLDATLPPQPKWCQKPYKSQYELINFGRINFKRWLDASQIYCHDFRYLCSNIALKHAKRVFTIRVW